MTMLRTTFPRDLLPGLNAHFGMAYRDMPEEWRLLFDVESSKKAFEEDVLSVGFGAAPVKAEGASIAYDDGAQGWVSRYVHETIALAFAITEEAVEDNLYEALGPKYAKALARALKHTKEIKAAAVLNNGFSSSYVGGDGVALLSTAHPLYGGGTYSNILATPADLSETAIESLLIQIRKAKDDRGVPIALSAKFLVVPPELEYTSIRLTRSDLRTGTPDNDINAIKAKGVFNKAPVIITRLTSPTNWFIRTDCPDGLKHMSRVGVQRGTEGDWDSGNLKYKARERYAFGWSDSRSLWASGS
jgi:hypothetical protein